MRTGSKNPDAVGLYGNMTKTQLQASVAKVNAIKNERHRGHGAERVRPRREEQRALAEAHRPTRKTSLPRPRRSTRRPTPASRKRPRSTRPRPRNSRTSQAVQKVAGYVPSKAETDKINAKYNLDLQPAHLGAMQAYIGSAYNGLNAELRKVTKAEPRCHQVREGAGRGTGQDARARGLHAARHQHDPDFNFPALRQQPRQGCHRDAVHQRGKNTSCGARPRCTSRPRLRRHQHAQPRRGWRRGDPAQGHSPCTSRR
jgi:hypothetical protein